MSQRLTAFKESEQGYLRMNCNACNEVDDAVCLMVQSHSDPTSNVNQRQSGITDGSQTRSFLALS